MVGTDPSDDIQPRTPEDVQAALDELGLGITVTLYDSSTATAQQAADSIGCALGAIVKSLCFTVDGDPIVVLAAGDRRVDTRKIAGLYGVGRKKVKIASAETTLAATGFEPGGVSPVAHATALPIWVDDSLQRFETVYAAAGSPKAIFPIQIDTLVEVTGGTVADVTKPPH